jgi:guanine nucleotide-binding protein alpha-1 subunit
MGGTDKSDPFAIFVTPPPNETAEQRISREKKEAEAQRENDRIDDELKIEKAAAKKHQKGLVKVLLLGQSESGKSTTLKSSFAVSVLIIPFLHPSFFNFRFPHEIC